MSLEVAATLRNALKREVDFLLLSSANILRQTKYLH